MARMTAASHTIDCSWHADQYPQECDCGEIVGKKTRPSKTVEVDRQLFEAMLVRLQIDERIFNQYGGLHEKKGTRDGHEKAVANFSHANKIRKILMRLANVETTPRPFMDAMMDMIEAMETRGEKPAAFMITKEIDKTLTQELRVAQPYSELVRYTAIGGRYRDIPISLIPDAGASGLLLLSETSLVYKTARAGGHV